MGHRERRLPQLRHLIRHPEFELVGVHAYIRDKVGRDAATLCGLAEETGVRFQLAGMVADLFLEPLQDGSSSGSAWRGNSLMNTSCFA